MKLIPKSIIKRLLVLCTACSCMLSTPAKAEYMDGMARFYLAYDISTEYPSSSRRAALAAYQKILPLNVYLAYSAYITGELQAKAGEIYLYFGYSGYYDAQSWLADYAGNPALGTYYYDLGVQWASYASSQNSDWQNYYQSISDYYNSIFQYQLSIGTAY